MVQQMQGQSNTGTTDQDYNLISVLYHALQSAAVCDTYMEDAEQAGDRELTEFFQQVKEQNCEQAERAKKLMAQRIGQ
ncbi:hypothetical protein Sta7437_2901 [Stanieria cyanosphaera PCC 7437]|uniref:Uncharacterized protein n=1 Tax=Stanieria cyanosphaera (strain ATCC 29371 / PCC 7437) TaxID=111780 RepID=K9XUZ0_STAC7|nr:hypothetical protein [Stanieria cyanosphaera]AFZ36420.1 hypothetical protein Sta7437_2901 [Stanieria cyanosphaera PCC 7437]